MEELFVFCINCEKLVNAQKISEHSEECLEIEYDEIDPIIKLNLKLKNYRITLKDYLKEMTLNKKVRHVVKSCIKKSREAELESDELKVFLKIYYRLEWFLKEFDSVAVEVVVSRLKEMVEEKGLSIIETQRSLGELSEMEADLTFRKDLNCASSEYFKCEKIELDEMDSFTLLTMEIERSEVMETERDEYNEVENDRLFQFFLNIGLMCRLNFNYKHPAQIYSLKKLFYESKKLGVRMEDWEDFVLREFNQLDVHRIYN